MEILGSFQKGWIEVKEVSFHTWTKKHLVNGCSQCIIKLVDLSKFCVKVKVKENALILATMEISNEAWIFTTTIVVAREEDGKDVSELAQSKRDHNLGRLFLHSGLERNQSGDKPPHFRVGGRK